MIEPGNKITKASSDLKSDAENPPGRLVIRREEGGSPLKYDDYIPSIQPWMQFSSLFMVLGFLAAIGFMAVCPFRIVVKAQGYVRPSGELSVINSPFEGRLKSLNVVPNQAIEAGQVVVTLDQNDLSARLTESNQGGLQLQRQIISQKGQAKAEYEAAVLEVEKNRAELNLAQSEYRRFQVLSGTGSTSQQQLEEKQAAYYVAKADLAKSMKTLIELQSRSATLEAQLRREIVSQRATTEKIKRDLRITEVRSPVRGYVYRLDVRSPGQTIGAGQPIASIAPSEGKLIIKAIVPSEEINNVRVGQTAILKITGCPHPDFGVLKAKVVSIAPDATAAAEESKDVNAPTTFRMQGYEVRLIPEKNFLSTGKRICKLRIGMDLSADIITRNESMLVFVLRKARIITGS